MADYHFVYEDVKGASTRWDDIQRKLGNLPLNPLHSSLLRLPLLKTKTKDKAWIDKSLRNLKMILMMIDSSWSKGFLLIFGVLETGGQRKKRLAEIREAAKIARFESVMPISGSDFVLEVSQAPPDVWVVVILYKDSYPECRLLSQCLEELARKYPATKFVKIISTNCIPNYPDRNLPTVLVYNNGAVKANYVGLHSFGQRCNPEGVALVLCQWDPILNDVQVGSEQSMKDVLDEVRERFIEKVVAEHEDDDGSSSD